MDFVQWFVLRLLSSSAAAGNGSSRNTAKPTQHNLSTVESSAESASHPLEKTSIRESPACLIAMVVAIVIQVFEKLVLNTLVLNNSLDSPCIRMYVRPAVLRLAAKCTGTHSYQHNRH